MSSLEPTHAAPFCFLCVLPTLVRSASLSTQEGHDGAGGAGMAVPVTHGSAQAPPDGRCCGGALLASREGVVALTQL